MKSSRQNAEYLKLNKGIYIINTIQQNFKLQRQKLSSDQSDSVWHPQSGAWRKLEDCSQIGSFKQVF
jgi:hypothetical protein